MSNYGVKPVFLALLTILTCLPCLQAQNPSQDLTGTWSGETAVQGDTDHLTLILKKQGDSYTGSISDSIGYLNQAPLQNFKFEKGVITFFFMVSTGNDQMRVDSTLKVENGKLTGSWSAASGETGNYVLERKK